MKQLVDCVGMSARKKVLESGRKPRILNIFSSKSGTMKGTKRKELRFEELARPIPGPDYSNSTSLKERSRSLSRTNSTSRSLSRLVTGDLQTSNPLDASDIYEKSLVLPEIVSDPNAYSSAETTDSEGGAPPSPSPSPRPGSAMSTMSMSMFSRRSATPTANGFFGSIQKRPRSASVSRLSATFHPPSGDRSVTAATAVTAFPTSRVPSLSTTGSLGHVLENAVSLSDHLNAPESTSSNVQGVDAQDLTVDNRIVKSSCDDQLHALEERHGKIIRDIQHLERRLGHFLSLA